MQDKPFLIPGGELHNSSASSLEYMQPIWPRLKALNLNTVLPVVSWELIEPREGQFDFRLVDGLMDAARKHDLKLVLLWFGSWKNGVSTYVPAWVKQDIKRFPRVQNSRGDRVEVLTPLSDANFAADTRALVALTKHLRQIDQDQQTVVMIQVQNEVGLLGDSRDRSPLAEEAFGRSVPAELTSYFAKNRASLIPEFKTHWEAAGARTSGTWAEVFGEGADEAFMAWHMASYIGRMAAAAKAEYPLPMYANAWLVQNEKQKAGQYPSGGPVSKVMDIWRAAAPAIDLLAPDIYLPDFKAVCASYVRNGNPLFIPEASRGPEAAAKAFYAYGQHAAIGFCPFGIDSLTSDHPLRDAYDVLNQLGPTLLQAQADSRAIGMLQDKQDTRREMLQLSGWNLEVSYDSRGGQMGYGLAISVGDGEFFVAGSGIGVHFSARTPGPKHTRILWIDEGKFINGNWVPGRRMNGDENAGGWRLQLPPGAPTIQRIKLYRHD